MTKLTMTLTLTHPPGTYLSYDINVNHSDNPSTPGREQRSNRQIVSLTGMGGNVPPSEYENYADIYGGYDSSNPNSPNRS